MELDQEQKEEFIKFIDTYKDIIRNKSHKFLAHHLLNENTLINHTLKEDIKYEMHTINFEAFCESGLFHTSNSSSQGARFIINQHGLKIYEELKNERILPFKGIEKTVIEYLKSSHFIDKFPKAYKKWLNAENVFSKELSNENLTTIGHLCRESLQEFSDELLEIKSIQNTFEKSKIIDKMRAIFDNIDTIKRSKSTKAFLNALLNYWGSLSDLVQKQEHDSQKEGEILTNEDARRIIFHTAIIMYEIDKTI